MKNIDFIKNGLASAFGLLLYVGFIVFTITNLGQVFSGPDGPDNLLGPVIFLMLFVFSALISSSIVLGYPLWLFLNGKKRESIIQIFYTGSSIFLLLIVVVSIGILLK